MSIARASGPSAEERLKNLWVGKKVISLSNSFQHDPGNNSISIGTVIDLVPISQSKTLLPLVLYNGEKEPMLSFSTIIEYTEKLWVSLNKLDAKERWDILMAFCYRYQALDR